MTRRFRWLLTLALALVAGALPFDAVGPAEAQQFQRFQIQVVGDDHPFPTVITDGRCRVLNAGLQTDATIYTTGTLATAATNPLTIDTSNGTCEWYSAVSASTGFDVQVFVTAGPWKGAVVRVDNVTRTGRKNVIVSRSQGIKALTVTIPVNATLTTQVTTLTLPVGALVTNALLETTTAVAAATTEVGLPGTGNFGKLCSVKAASAVGVVDCAPTAFVVASGQTTIQYNTQNHATAGYMTVYYLPGASNEP